MARFLAFLGSVIAGASAYLLIANLYFRETEQLWGGRGAEPPRLSVDHEATSDAVRIVNGIAGIDAAAEVEVRLERVLAGPRTATSSIEVETLFVRLAVLDISRALLAAEHRGFDLELVGRLFRAWAEADPDGATRHLGTIRSRRLQTVAALGILATIGQNVGNIARISEALPAELKIDFESRALAERARSNPQGALAAALESENPAVRSAAVQRIGVLWSHDDPSAAYAYTNALPFKLRDVYRDTVTAEWARLDTTGFLRFLQDQPRLDDFLLGIGQAMANDPQRVFELASTKPSTAYYNMGSVERVAFGILAQLDLAYARNYVTALPYNPRGRQLTDAFAEAFARAQPAAALAWARGFDPPRPGLEASIIEVASETSLEDALSLLDQFSPPPDHPAVIGGVAAPESLASRIGAALAGRMNRREIADRLALRTDVRWAATVLLSLTTQWVQHDPVGALNWIFEHRTAADDNLVRGVAANFAARDATAAALYLERLPQDVREIWVEEIASFYARQHPHNAAIWIKQFEGQEGYDVLLRQVIIGSAQTDAPGAAVIFMVAPAAVQRSEASIVAAAWAREDLPAAARWASTLSDPITQTAAATMVAGVWASRDPIAVQRWARSLVAGDTRDKVLATIVRQILREGGDFEPAFMDAFSSDPLREAEIVGQLDDLARRDPDHAERVLRTWVKSPLLLSEGEQLIAASRAMFGL